MKTKVAVVTGAAGGFARITVRRLLASGWQVHGIVRGGAARLASLGDADLARALKDGTLRAIDLDLTDFARIRERLADSGLGAGTPVHALLNLAGYPLFGPVSETTPEELKHQLEVNLMAPLELARALLPGLLSARGIVINMSSLASQVVLPLYGGYAASKAALESATEALRHELLPLGVRVALVLPAGYETGFQRSIRFTESALQSESHFHALSTRFKSVIERPVGDHLGDPQEVVDLLMRLIEARSPRLRNPIGKGARSASLLRAWVPERLYLPLVRFGFARFLSSGARPARIPNTQRQIAELIP